MSAMFWKTHSHNEKLYGSIIKKKFLIWSDLHIELLLYLSVVPYSLIIVGECYNLIKKHVYILKGITEVNYCLLNKINCIQSGQCIFYINFLNIVGSFPKINYMKFIRSKTTIFQLIVGIWLKIDPLSFYSLNSKY